MERLNQWLTLVANFGVVIGIVFLAYEMRLNTNAMLSGTAAQMVTNWNSISMTLAADQNLSEALVRSRGDIEQGMIGDPVQGMRIAATASSMYRSTEYEFLEYHRGNVDQEVWKGHLWSNSRFISSNPFMVLAWRFQRQGFASSFRDFMDDMIRDICSKQECPEGGRPEDWTELST